MSINYYVHGADLVASGTVYVACEHLVIKGKQKCLPTPCHPTNYFKHSGRTNALATSLLKGQILGLD